MAFPSYTYTFTNGSTADGTQVNQNFSDILNGVSDGTKDISVKSITGSGSMTFSGPVILGASTSSDLTFNGSVATSIPVKTNTSFDFGTATLGMRSFYVGGTSTFTTRIMSAATSSWTLTLPINAGTGTFFLQTDGSGNTTWANVSEPILVQNLGLASSVATNALTIALKTLSGADPTSALPVTAAFRNATLATGQYNVVSRTSALSIVIPSGATLGHTSAVSQYVWVYLINDAGTIDIGVSGVQVFFDTTTVTCTQISAGATSGTTLYTTSAHSGAMPTRLIGRFLVNEATAGTWASAPSEGALMPVPTIALSEPVLYNPTYSVGFATTSSNNMYSFRRGNMLCCFGQFNTGTPLAGSAATMTIGYNGTNTPTGILINTSVLGGGNTTVGHYATAGNAQSGNMLSQGGNTTVLGFGTTFSTASSQLTVATANAMCAPSATVTVRYEVPISGWSAYGPL